MGVLRSRTAHKGGPLMEFTCPGCGHRFTLIPHGGGRYARPGEPPPPPGPDAERVPPWQGAPGRDEARAQSPPPRPPEPPPVEPTPPPEEPIEIHEVEEEEDRPLTVPEALALLEVPPTADREAIERAFRRKSRTCHPDKVAHLDPEFQELAERKFRRLRGAYEILMG